MKKSILLLIGLIALNFVAFADKDVAINYDELPTKAKTFIETHFNGQKVSLVKAEKDFFDVSYEVFFTEGNKIEFDKRGEWTEINCKFSEVPAKALPEQIINYVKQNYPTQKIVEAEKNKYQTEIKLGSGLELAFDNNFRLIDIDN
ncbi:MAG: PepSY-like domain-containing protein [Culturomica sp.]|jgi:hypothetical protein|nr:PepSY-like domain-containing protein [Culturomica sp.]